jgi:hypothetical protein
MSNRPGIVSEEEHTMASENDKAKSKSITVNIKLQGQQKGQELPQARAYLFDRTGRFLDSKVVEGKPLAFSVEAGAKYQFRVGPDFLKVQKVVPADLAAQLDKAKAITQDYIPVLDFPDLHQCARNRSQAPESRQRSSGVRNDLPRDGSDIPGGSGMHTGHFGAILPDHTARQTGRSVDVGGGSAPHKPRRPRPAECRKQTCECASQSGQRRFDESVGPGGESFFSCG